MIPSAVFGVLGRVFSQVTPEIQKKTLFRLGKVPRPSIFRKFNVARRCRGKFLGIDLPFRARSARFDSRRELGRERGTRRFTVARILNGHLRRPSKLKRTNLTVHTASCRRRGGEGEKTSRSLSPVEKLYFVKLSHAPSSSSSSSRVQSLKRESQRSH